MFTYDISTANEKQVKAFESRARFTAYGGARGGGKSWFVRKKAVGMCLFYPGIRILIIRRTYKELRRNHIRHLKSELNRFANYNNTEKELVFPNGSVIQFGYCRNDADLDLYQGDEYDVIFIDEATHFTDHQRKTLNACLRGANNFPKRGYYTCNPGGIGHAWVKRLFIDRIYNDDETAEHYEFIQALHTDNKALNPEYGEFLDSLPENRKKAWRDGMWDVFEGLAFPEWKNNVEGYKAKWNTHVIEPFDIPRGWQRYRSFDYGSAKPFSVGWYAVDYDGRMYRYRELYGSTGEPNVGVGWSADRIADEIKRIEKESEHDGGDGIIGIADPAIFNTGTGSEYGSIADMMANKGVHFSRGKNARIPGWNQVRYRLQFDKNGYPMFYVFGTCKHFIRTFPNLQYSQRMAEDVDSDMEDHAADEFRYMAMHNPLASKYSIDNESYVYDAFGRKVME